MKENNILLAEFLGWEDNNACMSWNVNRYDFKPEQMLFDSDWNWLMLVVEKIENLETEEGNTFTIDFHRDSVLIFEYGKYTNEIVHTEGLGRMQNLYNSCIEFIKWYNK